MKSLVKIIAWWLVLVVVWSGFRNLGYPEPINELVGKPIIWIGITAIFLWQQVIPHQVVTDLSQKFLKTKPFTKIILLPIVFTVILFGLVNMRVIRVGSDVLAVIPVAVLVNFMGSSPKAMGIG